MPAFSLPVFADAAARASVILAMTGLVAVLMRRSSASARHLVWVLGLGSALLVPALSIAVPKLEVPIVRIAAPASPSEPVALSVPAVSVVPPNGVAIPREGIALPPEGGSYRENPVGRTSGGLTQNFSTS